MITCIVIAGHIFLTSPEGSLMLGDGPIIFTEYRDGTKAEISGFSMTSAHLKDTKPAELEHALHNCKEPK